MAEFRPPITHGERTDRVRDAQWTLRHNRFKRDFDPGPDDGIWGKHAQAAADEARFELGYPLRECKTGRFGQKLYDFLRKDAPHKLPADYLIRRRARLGKRLVTPGQSVALPSRVHFPNVAYAPVTPDRPPTYGLQPWIAPQVAAICKRFDLWVTDGHGGHPPHGYYSDHRWGGGVDLAGRYTAMVACTFWADRYCSGWYRRGMVFRWVGGPAPDANGIEHGHYNHVHLSWFRLGPATTIFGTTREFH